MIIRNTLSLVSASALVFSLGACSKEPPQESVFLPTNSASVTSATDSPTAQASTPADNGENSATPTGSDGSAHDSASPAARGPQVAASDAALTLYLPSGWKKIRPSGSTSKTSTIVLAASGAKHSGFASRTHVQRLDVAGLSSADYFAALDAQNDTKLQGKVNAVIGGKSAQGYNVLFQGGSFAQVPGGKLQGIMLITRHKGKNYVFSLAAHPSIFSKEKDSWMQSLKTLSWK